nr:hypothetical protein [Thiocapsa sp. KS1]
MSAIRRLLARAQPGSSGGVAQHIRRGERLAALIKDRWGINRPEQWRSKHARWAIEHGLADASPATRYHYYRTIRVLAAAMGHWPNWEPHLRGAWTTPTGTGTRASADRGGRPPKLAQRGAHR